MGTDGTYTAVLDRFEDDLAVLVVEANGDVSELVVAVKRLPEEGRHQDAVFTVDLDDGTLQDAHYEPVTTEERTETAQERFDRLAERRSDEET
jgi:hypothetical protein